MVFSPERSSLLVPGSIRLGAVASGTSLTHTAIFNAAGSSLLHAGADRPPDARRIPIGAIRNAKCRTGV